MSSESGQLHVSHGVHYEEHHGVMAKLAFGQELAFCAGSEMKVLAGMESAFVVGAENKVGVATNSIFELGAEVKYVRGWAVEIAHEGGGAYEHAFTATAGSSKLGAFNTLKGFFALSILGQVAAVSAILINVKTKYVEDGKLTPTGESGAKTTLAISQNIAGVVMFLGTVALNMLVRKFLHVEPLSAVTVNHESQAFIGVRGSAMRAGTAGVEITPKKFFMSVSKSNRDFRTSGHEVVGYGQGFVESSIEASDSRMTITSPAVLLQVTQVKPTSLSLNDGSIYAWAGSDQVNPTASMKLGKVKLAPSGSQPSNMDGIRLAVGNGSAVSMASDWVRVSVDDGSQLDIEKGKQAKLSYANSSASVLLKQTEASLNFGTQSVKIGPTGVDIAGGAIKILAPGVAMPDALGKVTVSAEILAVIADNMKDQVESIAVEQSSAAYDLAMRQISSIKRSLETKISQATTKAGAV